MKKILKFLSVVLLSVLILFLIAFAVFPLPGDPTILMYHFVRQIHDDEQGQNNIITEKHFLNQMRFLKMFGYRVISLDELHAIKKGEKKSKGREVAITFDDGDYSFNDNAFPILEKYQFPTTVFYVSENIKQQLHGSMTIDDIKRALKADWFQVGAHTKTHPFLSEMPQIRVREELVESKKDLESMFERPVHYLAYPYGNFDEGVKRIAEESGYQLAFTTSYDKLRGVPEGPYSLTRTKVSRSSKNPFIFWVKVSGLYDAFKSFRYRLKNASA